jgi:hypothetical protein
MNPFRLKWIHDEKAKIRKPIKMTVPYSAKSSNDTSNPVVPTDDFDSAIEERIKG